MPKEWGEGDVVDRDNKNYYRNVQSFTNRVRVAAATRDARQRRQNLDVNLRGEAELWWNTQLSEVSRLGLVAHPNGVEEWCKALEKRFKISPSEAWTNFNLTRYTLEDVRNHRNPIEYVTTLIAAARNRGQGDSEVGLVMQGWMHVDMALCRDIDQSREGTNVEEFLDTLLAKQANWYDLYSRPDRTAPKTQGQYNSNYRAPNPPNRPAPYFPYCPPYQQYQSYQPLRYGNFPFSRPQQYNNFPQPNYQPRQQGAAPLPNTQLPYRPPLQITAGNERQSPGPSRFGNQPQKPFNNRPNRGVRPIWRGARGGHGDRAYWAHEASVPEEQPVDDQVDYQSFEDAYYSVEYQDADMPEIQDGEVAYEPDDGNNADYGEAVVVGHVAESRFFCRACKEDFPSKNKLHQHIRTGCQKPPKGKVPELPIAPMFVKSTAGKQETKGYGFRGWRYATAMAHLTKEGKDEPICLDTSCTMSLVDKDFLMEQALNTTVRQMASPIQVRGIGAGTHQYGEHADLIVYLPGDKARTAVIQREVHIVRDLKAKMLVRIDIMGPEKISIMMDTAEATVGSCKTIRVPLSVHTRSANQVKRTILTERKTTISPRSQVNVNIVRTDLPKDRDLLFEPESQLEDVMVYAHIVDHSLTAVQVQNGLDTPLVIPQKT